MTSYPAAIVLFFASTQACLNAFGAEYVPKLFDQINLIYEDNFDIDGKHQKPTQWVIRQNTNWSVKDGILTGGLADVAYQKMMQAKNDGHDGTRAVIFLKPVPTAFVIQLRVRYNETEKRGRDRGSLLDLGHHVNSFIFRKDGGVLTLQKKKRVVIPKSFFPLNQWNEVTIEFTEGAILITVNERSRLFEDPLITLKTAQEAQQIDFKGQDFGSVQLDWVKLYEGMGPRTGRQ
ncbi:MAG TPA: hypothetical protein DEF45_09145 [Rhodopirellula sp.]|nr:hypothetical protein [Rhodopirellula sp.]